MSSNRLKVSGAGCRRETRMVHRRSLARLLRHRQIWKVVLLSSPVEISS